MPLAVDASHDSDTQAGLDAKRQRELGEAAVRQRLADPAVAGSVVGGSSEEVRAVLEMLVVEPGSQAPGLHLRGKRLPCGLPSTLDLDLPASVACYGVGCRRRDQ